MPRRSECVLCKAHGICPLGYRWIVAGSDTEIRNDRMGDSTIFKVLRSNSIVRPVCLSVCFASFLPLPFPVPPLFLFLYHLCLANFELGSSLFLAFFRPCRIVWYRTHPPYPESTIHPRCSSRLIAYPRGDGEKNRRHEIRRPFPRLRHQLAAALRAR